MLMRKPERALSAAISALDTGVQATAMSSLDELSLDASKYCAELPMGTRPSIRRWWRGKSVRQRCESGARPRPPIWRATTRSSCGTLESIGMLICPSPRTVRWSSGNERKGVDSRFHSKRAATLRKRPADLAAKSARSSPSLCPFPFPSPLPLDPGTWQSPGHPRLRLRAPLLVLAHSQTLLPPRVN